jgi:spore cortex formation protein SpoVR/YcgB (stage V sporulation)
MIKAKPNISQLNTIKQLDNQLTGPKQCINRISGRIRNHFKISLHHNSPISNQSEVNLHISNSNHINNNPHIIIKLQVQEVHNLSIVVPHNPSSSISNHNILKVVLQAITNLWTPTTNNKVIEILRNSETQINHPINRVMVGSRDIK